MLRRAAILLLAGTALAPWTGLANNAWAEDVTVNLDALGPEPAKKPAAKPVAPVASEVVPDAGPAVVPKPAAKPKPKPVAPAPAASPSGEIDFISRTRRAQGVPEALAPAATKPKPAAPVVSAAVPDEAKPEASPPAFPANPPVTAAPPPAKKPVPKKKETPATVVVDTGGLDSSGGPGAKPRGTPLTAIQPDGVLYVPKNVEALPQPVSVPSSAQPDEVENKPLTLPPALPDAPLAVPDTPPAAAPVQPTAMIPPPAPPKPAAMALPAAQQPAAAPLQPSAATPAVPQPPSTQAIAAVAPQASSKPAAPQARASVLSGQATALEVRFEPGLEILTSEAIAALDQIAEPLKAGALRVQLAAYSGPPGNNSSDTRRLSLKRALAVRDYLDSRGVPKLTVNIAAFGGAVQGETDRVDIMVRTDQLGALNAPQ